MEWKLFAELWAICGVQWPTEDRGQRREKVLVPIIGEGWLRPYVGSRVGGKILEGLQTGGAELWTFFSARTVTDKAEEAYLHAAPGKNERTRRCTEVRIKYPMMRNLCTNALAA